MTSEAIAYDRQQMRAVLGAFRAMDQEAIDQARKLSGQLASDAADRIKQAAAGRIVSGIAAQRIAYGVRISKSSKIGEFSYGFASQRFSGGATTKDLWAGMEFGSYQFKQFPTRTPREGKGSAGYFIYPTLKAMQPYLVKEWQQGFRKILDEWS